MTLLGDLQHIEDTLRKLKKESAFLQEENRQLRSEKQDLLNKLQKFENNLSEIHNKKVTLQLAKSVADNPEKRELVSRIDEMVEEIDHCLKLLKNQFPEQ